jgi:hypothetical protein
MERLQAEDNDMKCEGGAMLYGQATYIGVIGVFLLCAVVMYIAARTP